MEFPITTETIVVIIDYDWVYYFLYLGFQKWKSIFRVIRSVIKLLQLKTESNQRDYRTSNLVTGATL